MYREQTERAGIHRRIQQGLCWYPVVPGKSYYNSLNQLVVEIGQLEDKRPNTILNMAVRSASSQQKEAGNLNTELLGCHQLCARRPDGRNITLS